MSKNNLRNIIAAATIGLTALTGCQVSSVSTYETKMKDNTEIGNLHIESKDSSKEFPDEFDYIAVKDQGKVYAFATSGDFTVIDMKYALSLDKDGLKFYSGNIPNELEDKLFNKYYIEIANKRGKIESALRQLSDIDSVEY